VRGNSPSKKLRKEISSNQWEMQSCFQGALDFFLLSFGFRVERLQVGGEVFFFQLYLVWRVDTRLSMQVLLGVAWGGREGRIYFPFNQ